MKMDLNSFGFGTNSLARSYFSGPAFMQVLALVNSEDSNTIQQALTKYSDVTNLVNEASKAYELFYTSLFDLIVCDLTIPGSLEFLSKISEIRSGLPIIAIAQAEQLEETLERIPNLDFSWIAKDVEHIGVHLGASLLLAARKTNRINEEIDLQTERNAYWAAANCAPEGVAILGEDGTVIFSNEKYNYFAAKIDPQTKNAIALLKSNNALVAEALRNQLSAASPGSIWQSEIQITQSDNSILHYEINLSVSDLGANSGAFDSYLLESNLKRRVLWIKDITAQKIQEQFLRDLVSTTSHDLKGPLGAISNAAEMLADEDGVDEGTFKVLVDAVHSCSRKSIKVIEELLDSPSIKVSAQKITKVSVPINALVKETAVDFGPTAMAKSISINVRANGHAANVLVDKVAIYRAFSNLLSNAIKFSRPGESVEVYISSESDEFVSISFKDRGPGIAAQEVSQLFQRFGRLNRTKSVEGTGLGLFAVKNIIDAHEGRIVVESELGVGATFTVFLPKAT